MSKKIKVNDRVKRANVPGCLGVVKDVRTEVTQTSMEEKDSETMVHVLWDNGTTSCFSPAGLETVKDS